MVRKIQGNEYLKRYDNMSADERREYLDRVGEWLSVDGQALVPKGEVFEARMQNVQQVSTAWNDRECQAFEDGARLLSAMVPTAETWLPEMLYVKSAKRAIRKMFEVLWSVEAGGSQEVRETADADRKPKEERAEGTAKATRAVGGKSVGKPAGETFTVESSGAAGVAPDAKPVTVTMVEQGALPTRPKHIDQYVHLLQKKTQEHAALVQGLYRELDEARRKLGLLTEDRTAKAEDREAWAKKATKCDNTLRKILDELDAEWAKLVKSGRVVVDDLGNARIVPSGQDGGEQEPAELTAEQKARRRELRKWLTDTRRGNGAAREERVSQWKVNFREYLALEGGKAFEDEKVREAAAHYGIDMEELR